MGQEPTPLSTMTLLDFEFGVTESPARDKPENAPRSQLSDPEAYGVTAGAQVQKHAAESLK